VNHKICRLLERYAASTGEGVSVAVVDSGVEAGHPDIPQPAGGVVIHDRNGTIEIRDYDGVDVAGHGTACAARILSIAPKVSIVSCRVLNSSIASTSAALIASLQWVLNQPQIQVVNLSLGSSNPKYGLPIIQLVDRLYARGIPVVASRGYENQPDYPAAFGSTVSVTSAKLDRDDQLSFHPGEIVEFGARGDEVSVPWRGGGRTVMSGSSFAAPLVAGRIARFKQLAPDLRVWEIKTLLQYQAVEQLRDTSKK
jgi:subtilisin family serine protease